MKIGVYLSLFLCLFAVHSTSYALTARSGGDSGEPEAGDPLLPASSSMDDECPIYVESDEEKFKKNVQEWTDKNAKKAKNTGEVADAMMKAYDEPTGAGSSGDGKLTQSEVKDFASDLGYGWPFTGCAADKIIEKVDSPAPNNDGKLTKEEIKAALDAAGIVAPGATP